MDKKYSPEFINGKAREEFDSFITNHPALRADVQYVYDVGVPDRSKTYLMFEFARALDINKEKLIPFAIGAELMMAAAMNDDDFIDNSDERWGKPAFWKQRGANTTIVVSAYVYALIFSILKKYRPDPTHKDFSAYQRAENLMIDYFRVMHVGQYKSITSAKELRNLTLKDQEQLATEKSSLLFQLCSAVPAYFSNQYIKEHEQFGYWIGIARLYRSDIRDFLEISADKYKTGTRMEDYFTHQLNIVLVLTGKSDNLTEDEKEWFYDNWSNDIPDAEKASATLKVVELIEKAQSIDKAKEELVKIYAKLREYLKDLPASEAKQNIMDWAAESCLIDI